MSAPAGMPTPAQFEEALRNVTARRLAAKQALLLAEREAHLVLRYAGQDEGPPPFTEAELAELRLVPDSKVAALLETLLERVDRLSARPPRKVTVLRVARPAPATASAPAPVAMAPEAPPAAPQAAHAEPAKPAAPPERKGEAPPPPPVAPRQPVETPQAPPAAPVAEKPIPVPAPARAAPPAAPARPLRPILPAARPSPVGPGTPLVELVAKAAPIIQAILSGSEGPILPTVILQDGVDLNLLLVDVARRPLVPLMSILEAGVQQGLWEESEGKYSLRRNGNEG